MRFDTLPQIEERFRSEAAPALTPFALPVPDENLTLRGQLFKPNRSDYYYPTEHRKRRIVLHFTAGNVRSDIITLTQQSRHVSVPFVIARDGTIYQLFPSKYWSGHLGAGVGNGKGTGNPQDKATIGIELSNYGYLVPKGQTLETIYSRLKDPNTGKIGPVDTFCSLDNAAAYTKIDQPFREQTHYAAYTPAQLDSLIILLRFLTTKYNIPRQFLPPDQRFGTTQDMLNFKGIVSHINYRSSGKWDIGPAFDWNKVIAGVQAAAYAAIAQRDLVTTLSPEDEDVLTSEEAIEAEFPTSKDALVPEAETIDNEGYNPNDYEEKDVLEANAAGTKKKVYALLAGINNYAKVNKLGGCLNDVKVVKNYLKNNPDFDVEIRELTDEAATRAGVADGFRKFLSQAGKNDTVLFYYSGHGTQEYADPLWDETDGKLECLVCHDGGTTKASEFLLTDKELRFLINELAKKTKAHIVTVFDCCHSGDNTRNAALVGACYDGVRERRVTDKAGRAFPERAWSQFLFSDKIQEADVKGKKPAEFLPQGTHVQMAACESNQVALEVVGEGVFTKTLLKTLTDCGGNVTYNTLRSRIRQYMRAGFEQTPRIYMPLDAEKLLRKGFLNHTVEPNKMMCEATRSKQEGWQLNVGAIHGVKAPAKIILFDPVNPAKTHAAKVRKGGVFVDYTLLNVTGLNTGKTYKAEVSGLMTQELTLKMENHDGNPKEIGALTKALEANASGGFAFGGEKEVVKTEKDSGKAQPTDYTFHVRSGEVYLTRPDDPHRPLVQPILYLEAKDHAAVLETLRHVSRWHFIKNLQNKNKPENFPSQPLKIELSRVLADGISTPLSLTNGRAELDYEKSDGDWKGTLQVKITNTTAQDLYVCAAYLSKEFQCFLKFLPQRVQLLEAGKSVLLGPNGKDRINLKLGKVEQEYNWPQVEEALKFIVSTREFDAEALTLDALPGPLTTADREESRSAKPKGLDTEEDAPLEFSGWLTQTLHLVFKNPVYNRIPAKTLKALLDWDETAYFAAGLYCEVEPDETGQPTIWKLKKGLVVPEEERGLFDNIKMWLGNQIETAQRRKRYRNLKKDPNRLRLVAEGDSWFQYPIILQDTLDQLYKVYAICSFAEAGDTLENYLRTKDKQYLNAIGEEGVKFFLVSGGGNDVLGDNFKTYLRENPDANDPTPQKYLNQDLFTQLDKLDEMYTQMFNELFASYNDLHILVHCYDYLIPVDTNLSGNEKKSSWTGKHMIDKGIAPQEVREGVIRYIIDEFAGRLAALTQKPEFAGRVTFVDTRGLVPRTLWFDEIHPKNAGFQIVADKFIGEIERIKARVADSSLVHA